MKGTVKFYNMNKGYGFITGEAAKEYFFYFKDVKDLVVLNKGDVVIFDPKTEPKGEKAINIIKVREDD